MTEGSISSVVLLSQGTNLIMGFVGAAAAWGLLRFLDWINGTKFTDHMAIIDNTPLSLAIYRGLRFVGVLWFVAWLLK